MNRTAIIAFSLPALVGGCWTHSPTDDFFALVLTVSNPNPQVGDLLIEEVTFLCEFVGGPQEGVDILFEGHTDRLEVDPFSGAASIIFDGSDAGNVFAFMCSARDPQGVIVTSNEVLVTPTP